MTIRRSEISGMVLRRVSLTERERLMPAMACSTLTRVRESLRLWRFSEGLRSAPRGFFGLMDLLYFGLVTLKTGVLV